MMTSMQSPPPAAGRKHQPQQQRHHSQSPPSPEAAPCSPSGGRVYQMPLRHGQYGTTHSSPARHSPKGHRHSHNSPKHSHSSHMSPQQRRFPFASPSYDNEDMPSVAGTDLSFASSTLSDAEINALRSTASGFDFDSDSSCASSVVGMGRTHSEDDEDESSVVSVSVTPVHSRDVEVDGIPSHRSGGSRSSPAGDDCSPGRRRVVDWSHNSLLAATTSRASRTSDSEYRQLRRTTTVDTAELTTDERGNLKRMCSHVDEVEFAKQYLSVLFCGMGEVLDCGSTGSGGGVGRGKLRDVID